MQNRGTEMDEKLLTHDRISELIIEYLDNKPNGNWHKEKTEEKKHMNPVLTSKW